jgi:hypothetical protein
MRRRSEKATTPAPTIAPTGLEAGYEGMVAKDDASPYVGGRTLK